MKISFLPQKKLAKISVGLIVAFFVFLWIFYMFVASGMTGGDTFFSNPQLTIPILAAAISGSLSAIVGIVSIIKEKDRSILVFLSVLFGLFVIFFIQGEIFSPH
ncbi:MAG: hypothetical protein Q8P90_02605 [bacterium]|nr:hypothetical protein [bacterium]